MSFHEGSYASEGVEEGLFFGLEASKSNCGFVDGNDGGMLVGVYLFCGSSCTWFSTSVKAVGELRSLGRVSAVEPDSSPAGMLRE